MDNIFNTSLWDNNFPELLDGVIASCEEVGIDGLSNVKLPYNVAKRFSQQEGNLYRALQEYQINVVTAKSEQYKNIHATMLDSLITDNSNFLTFMKRLNEANLLFRTNRGQINRVAYTMF